MENGGYNRYAYEGVLGHEAIQSRADAELLAYEADHGKTVEDQTINNEDIDEAVEEVKEEQQEVLNGETEEPIEATDTETDTPEEQREHLGQ